MSWMQKLYQTYNEVEKSADLLDLDKETLAPLWHSPQTAHIKIVLSADGDFISAEVLPDKTIVMLPVTEDSEGRTSGYRPHALCDSIQYVAKDLGYIGKEKIQIETTDKKGNKKLKEKTIECATFDLYIKQLDAWCMDMETKNPKVLAIQKYVHKGTVLADLIKAKVVPIDSSGKLLESWSKKDGDIQDKPKLLDVLGQNPEIRKALVIWSVQTHDLVSETWKDKEVQQSWSKYYQDTLISRFCSVTGKEQKIRESHPAKLTYSGDKAKLISSNDKTGFTYLGRFEEANQAVAISAEVSHKAHAALRWLIERQGIRNDNQVTVVWATRFANADEDKVLSLPYRAETDIYAALFAEDNINEAADFGFDAAKIMKKRLYGYRAKLQDNDQISLLVLDGTSPGKGRAALTYYQECLPKDYFANLDAWIDDFSWYQRYKPKEGKPWLFVAPSIERIADTIFSKSELEDKSKKAKKQLYARLLPVIAGGTSVPIPEDLVRQSFQAACLPCGAQIPPPIQGIAFGSRRTACSTRLPVFRLFVWHPKRRISRRGCQTARAASPNVGAWRRFLPRPLRCGTTYCVFSGCLNAPHLSVAKSIWAARRIPIPKPSHNRPRVWLAQCAFSDYQSAFSNRSCSRKTLFPLSRFRPNRRILFPSPRFLRQSVPSVFCSRRQFLWQRAFFPFSTG